jgi:hypothetical protein
MEVIEGGKFQFSKTGSVHLDWQGFIVMSWGSITADSHIISLVVFFVVFLIFLQISTYLAFSLCVIDCSNQASQLKCLLLNLTSDFLIKKFDGPVSKNTHTNN